MCSIVQKFQGLWFMHFLEFQFKHTGDKFPIIKKAVSDESNKNAIRLPERQERGRELDDVWLVILQASPVKGKGMCEL